MATFPYKKLTVSKLEAGKRQLDCAIGLWFREGDDVSIHTLAAAAYEIIHAIAQKRGIKRDLLYDSYNIKDDYRKEFIGLARKPANFLKHADRDPDGILELNSASTIGFFIFGMLGLSLLGEGESDLCRAFVLWCAFHDIELATEDYRRKVLSLAPIDDLNAVREMRRREFLENFLRGSATIRSR